ncbi:MAG: HAMP domain-containing protein [Clostridiales bacterium]|nr:HAMP domain-containing protein [Clostridiales bacterium]
MSRKEHRQSNTSPKAIRRQQREFRVRHTSIFFMLWAVFTALSLLIVALMGISQNASVTRVYKQETSSQLRAQSEQIKTDVLEVLEEENASINRAIRHLSTTYDVDIFLLNGDGEILYPQDFIGLDVGYADNFAKKIGLFKERLAAEHTQEVVYEGQGEYIYGTKLSVADNDGYLYVSKSFQLAQAVSEEFGVRTLIMCIFIFVLSLALSGVVSGWFTKPIIEMKKKATALAQGDFDVDFHGVDYGQELIELADALNFARDELSKTDAMQKELIANVSHDFKTPLTMIKAYASMIIEISGDNPEKRNKHAQVIVEETDRLASLVTDILALSKIRSGLETLKQEVFDMSSYVQSVLPRFQYLVEERGYVIHTKIEKGLYTRGDELKLGQVLYNLIGNAVNYTGDNKRVFVELSKITDNVFRFAVTDTGKGIKEEELSTIWDRYYRSSETHKRPVQGTGLGLSIVKTILERHHFVYGVSSEVGVGSTFYVDFPLVTEEIGDTDENA